MKTLLLLLALTGTAQAASTDSQMAQLRGYTSVEEILSARMAPQGQPFLFSRYGLGTPLLDLMGTWNNPGAQRDYHNGVPNSVNVLLWYLNLHALAEEVARQCKSPTPLTNERFRKSLGALCAWPRASAKSEDALKNFWLALMGYDAPETEYNAWRDFFLTSSYKSKAAPVTLKAMTLAIGLNPYFLLQH